MSLFNYDQKINPIYCFAISCTQRRAAERTNRGSFAVRFFSGKNPLISAQSDGFNSVLFFSRFSLIWFICSSSLIFVLFCFFIYIDCGIDTRARNHLSRSLKQFFFVPRIHSEKSKGNAHEKCVKFSSGCSGLLTRFRECFESVLCNPMQFQMWLNTIYYVT